MNLEIIYPASSNVIDYDKQILNTLKDFPEKILCWIIHEGILRKNLSVNIVEKNFYARSLWKIMKKIFAFIQNLYFYDYNFYIELILKSFWIDSIWTKST